MIAVGEIPRKPQDIRGCTQVAREGILSQHALDQHGEPVDALAHVGVSEGQMHFTPGGSSVICGPGADLS